MIAANMNVYHLEYLTKSVSEVYIVILLARIIEHTAPPMINILSSS